MQISSREAPPTLRQQNANENEDRCARAAAAGANASLFQPQERIDHIECTYQELPIFAKHYVNTNRIHISNDPHDVEADDKDVDEQGPDREDPSSSNQRRIVRLA